MRSIHSATEAATLGAQLAPIGLVELDFSSGFVRLWSGIGPIVWNGNTWSGIGALGRLSRIQETTELRAAGIDLELSGVSSEVLTIANEEDWQGRTAKIWFAVIDDAGALVGEPLQVFSGVMDTMTLEEGRVASVRISAESRLVDLERANVRRYTAEDQRSEYPGDKGLDAVAALQELEIQWLS